MVQCPTCRVTYVANTLFCAECGLYLLESEPLGTDPLESVQAEWRGEGSGSPPGNGGLSKTGPLAIRLRIDKDRSSPDHPVRKGGRARELEIPLIKPLRLGRMDPVQDIFPEIDLTDDQGMEHGVSREHACIFQQGSDIAVQDLGSTNGTLLNGKRLAPYMPELLKDGDQLRLGKLLVEVSFRVHHLRKTPTETRVAWSLA